MPRRIPSLDGLRAVAILMVLLGHSEHGMLEAGFTAVRVLYPLHISTMGVSVFFVLSGFLITTLLVTEEEQTGRINLRKFYVRRFFRIVPVYYIYLTFVLLLARFGLATVPHSGILPAYLFLWNYSPHAGGWWFGHTWSLSMEEQFYIVWPPLVVAMGRPRSFRLAIWVIVAAPVSRVATYFLLPGFRGQIPGMLHTHGDALMFGAVAALGKGHQAFERLIGWSFSRKLHLAAAVILPCNGFLIATFRGSYALPIGMSVETGCILLLLVWLVRNPESACGKFLNARAVAYVGTISYSLYLWQQAFLRPVDEGWTSKFPLSIALTFLVGFLSYRLIEKPFLRLRDRALRPSPDAPT